MEVLKFPLSLLLLLYYNYSLFAFLVVFGSQLYLYERETETYESKSFLVLLLRNWKKYTIYSTVHTYLWLGIQCSATIKICTTVFV